ncbi:MAG: 4-hydroxy-tetrahydrodipicolinate synthase [Gammaproteobacteria bacterium]|nr:4-hydroxy-tetrahydrodipicolinate synthase [Rhodocyclaceae bacterium]MBU3908996.1 4-hydroxy-tetrahydrodipicolinate synthase [Gammaproteobacteria bacterium]MBU3988680.1 4-hydroxy-tetrahydrodipicolinate synthase [Gammaproteobacteria bacterium]MBU4003753.1 4-hydroxy-tetrahydrodipicolinate synthase [Gammaproteobacteria bacterium]MBU4021631.1 4-hydroxy-tetrahydrodipicolinate synthase [Gammaproteobacteria bacterium]
MIQGSIPAIVTPMNEDGALDLPALRRLLDWHIAEGTDAVVVVGTTGESPTVDMDEHCELIRATVEHVAGRIPVIAGTGANSTSEAIELARCAKAAGANAHLSVVPYYNKPTQEGLFLHFKTIAEAVDLPMILYNVPGRTVADLSNDTTLRLAQVPGIVGIKDATGNLERAADLIKRAPPGFAIYSGDDPTGLAMVLLGGHGVISVTANVAPKLMHAMVTFGLAADVKAAREINARLIGLHKQLFCEANPIPVKWACASMGLIQNTLRLPLTQLSADCHERVRAAMRDAGISA